ncbi:lipoxygenase [Leptolyngbya sp. FACHB-36]|uniref:lipoxygenase family protein n=1 Tax=Leptolyngbya sp. FACHB-36 TaxID=2692808 RepID=UPI0016819C9F|nr:lipoxygenase family protein [Leptolyngbya sp. FACHB-36]MBD2022195.1 lipoxygenase [Leptolyngbya sp. FACHB-36]
MVHFPPIEPQGHYRYDPSTLEPQGPARLFPYTGDDGTLRYIATKLRQNLLYQGKLSPPWSLLLQQLEAAQKATDESWIRVTTLLADFEIFQSDWFNLDLPSDEQFNTDYVRSRREMTLTLLFARRAGQTATQPDQARSRFYSALETRGRSLPVVSHIHQRDSGLSDREFARQRLAGQNPMVLQRVQSSDSLPAWAERSCTLADGRELDLVQLAENDRLFVADYPLLQFAPSDLQAGRYVGSPVALFQRSSDGLEPLLIQIEPGRVIAPNDPADDWMRAKLCVQTADVTHHELLAHLCYTHLAMEAFAIATPRQLPVTHPVYTLLRPHFRFLLAINTRGNTILLGEGAAIDKLMAPTRDACLDLMNRAYRARPFSDYALPTDIQQRGLEPEFLPEFPYRDDARLLWDAIAHYVTRYLHRYYPDDRAVLLDPYLQAWAAELGLPLEARPTDFPQAPAWVPKEWIVQTGLEPALPDYARVPGLLPDGKLANLQQLIDLATTVIFTCGPQHAAVNFSQFDYVGYTPNAPLALYSRPDTPASLAQLLPPIEQDLGQMELAFALSGIRWGQLGSPDLIKFADAGDRETLAQFQTDLLTIEQTIQKRDRQRLMNTGIAYPYLLPSRIPNSINI